MTVSQSQTKRPVEIAPSSVGKPEHRALEPLTEPVTVRTIQSWTEKGQKFACLTCYDALTARWLERAGIPLLLVGDSAAEVILGHPGTIHAPLDFMITINAAVKRGAPKCLVMADMPFMSYQTSEADAQRNAGRFMTEGLADAVKLEVDRTFLSLIAKLAHAGVPAVAHLGLKPQHVKREGGYRAAGRTAAQAKELITTAVAMEEAGATMILLEAMPAEVSQAIVEKLKIPVIGCGAGPACHGQIVVLQDLLGITDRQPAFAAPIAEFGRLIADSASLWKERVRTSDFGEHPYHMSPGEANALKSNP
jgi:3-methyl-2-oxobutanoate hydroxymethyltransferase